MEKQLQSLLTAAVDSLKTVASEDELRTLEVQYLGKKGKVTSILKGLKDVLPEDRPKIGKLTNEIKEKLVTEFSIKRSTLGSRAIEKSLDEWIDITLEPQPVNIGTIHPLSKLQMDIEIVCQSMGFQVLDGPHMETEFNNFEALNIPNHHPARDMQDTFWLKNGELLRTHTSPVQVRAMNNIEPPFRIIAPGRVFRFEATDASHENTFTQIEGLMIDKDISVANLIHTMKVLVQSVLGENVTIRLRPGYFPFVEPGFELDISCILCEQKGCSVCKRTGWLEFMGCGLVHPNVFKSCNLDYPKYTGFAFGFGLERLAMLKHGITDIRYFLSGDLKFLKQFGFSRTLGGSDLSSKVRFN